MQSLPVDVLTEIALLTDPRSYRSLSKVCKHVRKLWRNDRRKRARKHFTFCATDLLGYPCRAKTEHQYDLASICFNNNARLFIFNMKCYVIQEVHWVTDDDLAYDGGVYNEHTWMGYDQLGKLCRVTMIPLQELSVFFTSHFRQAVRGKYSRMEVDRLRVAEFRRSLIPKP